MGSHSQEQLVPWWPVLEYNRKMVEWQLSEVVLRCLFAQMGFWNDTSISCKERFRLSKVRLPFPNMVISGLPELE